MHLSRSEKINKAFDIVLLVIFLAAIYAPPIKTLVNSGATISGSEKRTLAPLPARPRSLRALESFPGRFNAFFNDHLGFRDRLIKTYNYIKVFWLHTSPVKKVLLGKDGWLYYTAVKSIEDYRGLEILSEEEKLKEKLILENRADELAARGIRYMVIVAPNKQSIYPEQLPDAITRVGTQTRMDQFLSYLGPDSKLPILDLRQSLRSEKAQHLLYSPTDTHWNPYGRFLAYRQITGILRNWFPDLKRLRFTDLAKVRVRQWGDLAWMLHLPEYFPEKTWELKVASPCAGDRDPGVDVARFQALNRAIPPQYIVITKGCDQARRRVLVFRDSFFSYIETYLAESFSYAAYFWIIPDMDLFRELVDRYQPDVVLEERSERLFFINLGTEKRSIDDLLMTRFKRMKRTLFTYHGGQLPGLETRGDVTASPTANWMLLKCAGGDPQLYLPSPAITGNQRAMLKVVIDCPGDTVLQLFYQSKGGVPYYNERESLKRNVKKGRNVILLELPRQDIRKRLRLDPGAMPGNYLLRELVLKSTSSEPIRPNNEDRG